MKQKNIVLMAVAVGCGLIAAFLTSRLGAGNTAPEMVDVIVAKKELKIGTVLEEKDFAELLTKAPYMRGSLPPDLINSFDELKGKRLSRTLRAGNYFAPSDVNAQEGIPLPQGTFMYAVRMDAVRASAGFVMPGSKVEVLALQRHPTDTNKVRSRLILSDMLAVAVDVHDRRPEGGGPAIPTITSVSLAVTPEQAKLLHNCESTGGELRLLLRGPSSNYVASNAKVDDWYDYTDLFNDSRFKTADQPKGIETVQVAHAKQDIPLNTKITADNLAEYFELRAYVAPAPSRAVKDLSDLKGRYVRIPLSADLPVLNSALADEELAPPPSTVVVQEVYKDRIVSGNQGQVQVRRPTEQHQLTIINGPRTETYTYQGLSKNDLRLRNANDPNPEPAPSPAPVDEKPVLKPEPAKTEKSPKPEKDAPPAPAKPDGEGTKSSAD